MGDLTCLTDGCGSKPSRRGFCGKHHRQGLADGSLTRVRVVNAAACSVEDCSEKPLAKGFCGMHWNRWHKHGDPNYVRTRSVCTEDGCEKIVEARGRCGTHNWRIRNHGSTTLPPRLTITEKFWAKVDVSGGPEACHPWTGLRDQDGYGIFSTVRKGTRRAHRLAIGYARGSVLRSDELALHHCDNPPCCNVAHLYVGDPLKNMQDKMRRGRHRTVKGTHCRNGHEYTADNVRILKRGLRRCLACHNAGIERRQRA